MTAVRMCVICLDRPALAGRKYVDLCGSCWNQFSPLLEGDWMLEPWFLALVSMQRAEERLHKHDIEVMTIEGVSESTMTAIEPAQTSEDIITELFMQHPDMSSVQLLTTMQSLGYTTSRSTIT